MRATIIAILWVLGAQNVWSADAEIFSCYAEGEGQKAKMILHSSNQLGQLQIRIGKFGSSRCDLSLRAAEHLPKAVLPMYRFQFKRENCHFADSTLDSKILLTLHLSIDLLPHSKKKAHLQWLRNSQPGDCKITEWAPQVLNSLAASLKKR